MLFTISEVVKQSFDSTLPLRICAIGCSSGAELFSLLWTLRQVAPDIRAQATGVDISDRAIAKARSGTFSPNEFELRGEWPAKAREDLFEEDGNSLHVKETFAKNVEWILGDARDPKLLQKLPSQHVVTANNFLVHMGPADAYACARLLPSLVIRGGLFVCRGIDLDVRQRIAEELRLKPVCCRLEEIHNADFALDAPGRWPWKYDGLEPLDKTRPNWESRYSAIFQVAS